MSGAVDDVTLLIDGKLYGGWTDIRVTRGIERCASDFHLLVSARWPGQEEDWPLRCFMGAELRLGADTVMTGYLDDVEPSFDADSDEIRIGGRSKTADLVDCHALIQGGEFRDSTFAAVCRSVAAPFGIEALDTANVGRVVIPTTAADQTEKCFEFLERLGRQAGVLLTDDPQGRLVIARTGVGRCSSTLVQGENILAAGMVMKANKRFDRYVVKAQNPAGPSWISELDRDPGEARRPGADAQPNVTGQIRDESVPRYRPFVMHAESNATPAQARDRALWQARRDAGAGLLLKVTVQGWRQDDGRLWQINELVPVTIPKFGLQEDLLVATTSFTLSNKKGRQTLLTLGPPDAYTPEPAKATGHGTSRSSAWWRGLAPARGTP